MVAKLVNKDKHEEVSAEENKDVKSRKKRKKKLRTRKFPIWLRLIVTLILFTCCLALGLMVGYGVIGDGNPADVFQKATWQHIIDIVNKE